MENYPNTPVDRFYQSRSNFTIIGLTGLAGSGCSTLASIMKDKDFLSKDQGVRKPEDIPFSCTTKVSNLYPEDERKNIDSTGQLVFKRKYTICYNFIQKQYEPFKVIKYTRALLLFVFLYAIEKEGVNSANTMKDKIKDMMVDKYLPSRALDADYKKLRGFDNNKVNVDKILDNLDWNALWNAMSKLAGNNYIDAVESDSKLEKTKSQRLSSLFFENSEFNNFVDSYIDKLYHKDYYCLCFMFHRLACCIRNWGNPFKGSSFNFDNLNRKYDHLFDIIKLINYIIKGTKWLDGGDKDTPRRIVIDSIRNSMEALYLKERYTAFYLIAVHDDENREKHFLKKVQESVADTKIGHAKNKDVIDSMYHCLMRLMDIEVDNGDYEKGKFHSPNVGQCIADAEIHIANVPEIHTEARQFYTMEEQWMKYAALILHPGLITPSSEERCMIVAYTAKFNSSCLSRQVGACITNQNHTIRSIGWNDVPYGQIPCSLRELEDIKAPSRVSSCYCQYMYSDFERGKDKIYDKNKHSFVDKVDDDYRDIGKYKQILKGLPLSFCFKTLQNRYEGEKNQVYTRSLHAEENAMMQMVKYGGESLMNGIIYVTASPCELCSKKLYQIGVRKIVYIDPYPGISRKQIIASGFKRPALKLFQGAYGSTYFKLYQPFMSYKDEISIRTEGLHEYKTKDELLKELLGILGCDMKSTYTHEEFDDVINKFNKKIGDAKDEATDNKDANDKSNEKE